MVYVYNIRRSVRTPWQPYKLGAIGSPYCRLIADNSTTKNDGRKLQQRLQPIDLTACIVVAEYLFWARGLSSTQVRDRQERYQFPGGLAGVRTHSPRRYLLAWTVFVYVRPPSISSSAPDGRHVSRSNHPHDPTQPDLSNTNAAVIVSTVGLLTERTNAQDKRSCGLPSAVSQRQGLDTLADGAEGLPHRRFLLFLYSAPRVRCRPAMDTD